MKKLIRIPLLFLLVLNFASCSSNNAGQDDLSISEIEDIEKTGEFSEEDFFKDEEVLEENGVNADLDGVDESLDVTDDSGELLSDTDIEDFEGENFDDSSDFESDMGGEFSDAEFDEFDEFSTDESVAQNEEFADDEMVASTDEGMGDITEDDVFAEFEESTQIAEDDMGGGETAINDMAADDFNFESAFEETPAEESLEEPTASDIVSDFGAGGDTSGIILEDPGSDVIASTGDVVDSNDQTASQILGSKDYTGVGGAVTEVVKSFVPVQKMKDYPFRRSGILLNALYIVRQGDTMSAIKEKIYGPGSSANLAQLNPTLRPNNLKVGEKVYYNSPNRPNDESKLLFYYEDAGMMPQFRDIASGESIRAVSEELLGHSRSWMEIWATNPELTNAEKWTVTQSHKLRYFPAGAEAPGLAMNTQPEVIEATETDSTAIAMGETPATTPTVEEPNFDGDMGATGDMGTTSNMGTTGNTAGTTDNTGFDQGATDFDQGFDDGMGTDQTAMNDGTTDMGAEPIEPNFDEGFENDLAGTPSENGNPDAAAQAIPDGFKPSNAGTGPFGLDQQQFDMILMGAGGLLLLIGLIVFARMRRKRNSYDVQEFDFGGNTQIDEQTKTHIDI